MSLTLTVLFFLFSQLSLSAPLPQQVAKCEVKGRQLWNPTNHGLSELVVDSASPRTIALSLAENSQGDRGSYLTYAHLTVALGNFRGTSLFAVSVTTTFSPGVTVSYDPARPLYAQLRFLSRIGGPEMVAELFCEPLQTPYLLLPTYTDYSEDPVYGVHYLSTTIPNLLSRAGGEHFYAGAFQSNAEFLAQKFCVAGSSEALAADMSRKESQALWRHDPEFYRNILVPDAVTANSIGQVEWKQPRVKLECVREHEERRYNPEDGSEELVYVCDEQKRRELPATTFRIQPCPASRAAL